MTEEYRTIAAGAGWIDRSSRGRIRVAGRDAASFLQALVSNDVGGLSVGQGIYATYLTPQGRMIADFEILHRGDWLMIVVAAELAAPLAERLDRLVFSEDVSVADVSADWMEFEIVGGGADVRISRVTGLASSTLRALPELAQDAWSGGVVVRGGDQPLLTYRIIVPAADATTFRQQLTAAEVVPVSGALAEALRIESARGRWGRELTTETIPLEAGLLERGISTTKGCYVGQEVIIRILHRGGGRVARRLALLALGDDPARLPPPGSTLQIGGQPAGHLTSVAWSPLRLRGVALGYVTRDHADVGTVLTVDATGEPAEVVQLAG